MVSTLYLLDKGANLSHINIQGNNAFAIAMLNKNFNLAILLLNHGSDWNTVVHAYSSEIIQKLYDFSCDNLSNPSLQHEMKSLLEKDEHLISLHGFRYSVRNNWQGLAYMILTRGYSLGSAVYDTILEDKFNYTFNLLTKSDVSSNYQFTSDDGNNLAHMIAQKSKLI